MTLLDRLRRTGYRRLGSPRAGFRYLAPGGRPPRAGELERIHALRLPPAWEDVYVAPVARAKLQAVGRDRAGRWQYRYHPSYRQRRENAKYRRLLRFAAALPRLRAAVDRDLRRRGPVRARVLACAAHLLATCFMRAGSRVYADRHHSYGVATLRTRHVTVEGDRVRFDYTGKAGKRQVRELEDRRVARLVKELLRLPGPELLQMVDGEGAVVDVRRRHVNAYLREVMGGPFTAKDFRTWAGTLLCASELARLASEQVPGRSDPKRAVTAALRTTAAWLGNTPAVCRASYVFPGVIDGFLRGRVLSSPLGSPAELVRQRGLHDAERALLDLLVGDRRRTTPAGAGAADG